MDRPALTGILLGLRATRPTALAKLIVKLLDNLVATIDADPAVRGRLTVPFLTEYCVSLGERLIPATDVSNQISTAGYEASGTSNIRLALRLDRGTVAGSRGWYNPHWHYDNQPEIRAALDLAFPITSAVRSRASLRRCATRCETTTTAYISRHGIGDVGPAAVAWVDRTHCSARSGDMETPPADAPRGAAS